MSTRRGKGGRVTMRDVAAAAGLSQPAVSMALRRHPRIAPATCERVIALAASMGYRPHPYVSALMSQLHGRRRSDQSPVIGVINGWPRDADPWRGPTLFGEFREGAEERAEQLGFRLEEFRFGPDGYDRPGLERVLQARGIAGLFIAPWPEPVELDLSWGRYAAATLGESLVAPHLHRAAVHQYANTWNLLEALRLAGAHQVALAQSAVMGARLQHAWLGAFEAWARLHPEAAVGAMTFDHRAPRGLADWLRRERPRALVHHDDAVRDACRGLPAKVRPRLYDLGVFRGSGAGVDPRRKVVAAAAIDLVVAQINRNERGIPDTAKVVMVEGRVLLDGAAVEGLPSHAAPSGRSRVARSRPSKV